MFKPFDSFACFGDTRAVEHGSFTIRATIRPDETSRPQDFDCFDANAVAEWARNEWTFCGIVLSVWLDDVCLDEHAASLWGIELNYPDSDNSYLAECANDMLPEAIMRADALRHEITAKLA